MGRSGVSRPYRTMSRYANMQPNRRDNMAADDVDTILANIRALDSRPVVRPAIGVNLLFSDQQKAVVGGSTRSRYVRRAKPPRKIPTVRKYVRPDGALTEAPSAAQYTPNFNVYLPKAPQIVFAGSTETRRIDPDIHTTGELLAAYQFGFRAVDFVSRAPRKGPVEEEPAVEVPTKRSHETFREHPEVKESSKAKGPPVEEVKEKRQLPEAVRRDTYVPKQVGPDPWKYNIEREFDRLGGPSFPRAKIAHEMEPPPDRTRANLGKSIDATKPRVTGGVLFKKQIPRDRLQEEKNDIWIELENEQKKLAETLYPGKSVAHSVREKRSESSFDKQVGRGRRGHPFSASMGPAETRDLEYDVEESLKMMDRKLQPLNHFGRRLGDSNRTIYAKSEAPDVQYDGVSEEWANAHPITSTMLPPRDSWRENDRSPY